MLLLTYKEHVKENMVFQNKSMNCPPASANPFACLYKIIMILSFGRDFFGSGDLLDYL